MTGESHPAATGRNACRKKKRKKERRRQEKEWQLNAHGNALDAASVFIIIIIAKKCDWPLPLVASRTAGREGTGQNRQSASHKSTNSTKRGVKSLTGLKAKVAAHGNITGYDHRSMSMTTKR